WTPSRRPSPPTSTRWPGRWPCWPSPGSARPGAAWPRRCRTTAATSPSPGCCAAPPPPTRPTGSRARWRWRSSSSACCARSPRWRTGCRTRRRPTCSGPSGTRWAGRWPRTRTGCARSWTRGGRWRRGRCRGATPAAGALAGLAGSHPRELAAQVRAMPETPETQLTLARLLAEDGDAGVHPLLDQLDRALPGDWRVTWYRGVAGLAAGHHDLAIGAFDRCVSLLPGERAPKLALAFALERAGRDPVPWYESVWRTDHAYVSAAFGLARAGRMAVLDEVPSSSSHQVAAQLA